MVVNRSLLHPCFLQILFAKHISSTPCLISYYKIQTNDRKDSLACGCPLLRIVRPAVSSPLRDGGCRAASSFPQRGWRTRGLSNGTSWSPGHEKDEQVRSPSSLDGSSYFRRRGMMGARNPISRFSSSQLTQLCGWVPNKVKGAKSLSSFPFK
jgi:hypothetical protein